MAVFGDDGALLLMHKGHRCLKSTLAIDLSLELEIGVKRLLQLVVIG